MESVIDKKSYAGIVINTEKTGKKREIYIELEAFKILKEAKEMKMATFSQGLSTFKKWAKLDFDFTAHTLRRTFATAQANLGVPAPVIAMSLGNSVKVVLDHYVIDSDVNFEACDIANSFLNGSIKKTGNMYVDKSYLEKQ
ncbi:hypothetical protein FACS1894166_09670 [Bacilli bacterium]|nr:hypothetical protein FACS1894166_09670 [Bacilli bacterium]